MGSAAILGQTYATVIMPDGTERLAENFRHVNAGIGRWWNDGASDDGKGAFYTSDDMDALPGILAGTGWRVDVLDDTRGLFEAAYGPDYEPPHPNLATFLEFMEGPFGAVPVGYYNATMSEWISSASAPAALFQSKYEFPYNSVGWRITPGVGIEAWSSPDTADGPIYGYPISRGDAISVRLVKSDPDPRPGSGSGFSFAGGTVDLLNAPERGYQPVITPSLTWNQLPSGVWRCLDDGAEFDAHDVDLTYLVSTAALQSWEVFISANRGAETTLYVPAGVQPFGPHIDASAGLPVVVGNAWKEAGRIGTKADCWTLHIPLRLQSAYTPMLPSGVPPWLGRKYATPDWSYPTIIHGTEAGRSVGVARGPEAQTTTITVDNLNTATAAEAVNWALHTRGSSFTYTPVAGMYPFGPAIGDGPFTCRLIEWSIQKPRPNRWDMQITLARE